MMKTPRALIVDDDAGFLEGLTELVKREGFVVSSARSLKQAREEIAANPPDILLVDLHLPGLDDTGWTNIQAPIRTSAGTAVNRKTDWP